MEPQRSDIVGHRIIDIWESPLEQIPYVDHFLSLDNGLLIKISWGQLKAIDAPLPTLTPAQPSLAEGAPLVGGVSTAPTCVGQLIDDVLYSCEKDPATGNLKRRDTFILLGDGRYLASSTGFCYNYLEVDSLQRWYRENKFAKMFRVHWGDEQFNPFGDEGAECEWHGFTTISTPSEAGGTEQVGEP
jgi:hypothetical protein